MNKLIFSLLVLSLLPMGLKAAEEVTAIKVSFSDFGTGASGKPQKIALDIVAEGIKTRIVGNYNVYSNGHHGESTFCVGSNTFMTGKKTDLAKIYGELEKLKPQPKEKYTLKVEKIKACESEE
jgi:hypothetical protein